VIDLLILSYPLLFLFLFPHRLTCIFKQNIAVTGDGIISRSTS